MEVESHLAHPCQEDKARATEGGKTKPEKPQMRKDAHWDGEKSHMQRCRLGKQQCHKSPWRRATNADMFRMLMTFKRKQNGRMKGRESRAIP